LLAVRPTPCSRPIPGSTDLPGRFGPRFVANIVGMTSPISPLSPVPIEDLRRRVREAESLLGVARGLARDELHNPESCERARDRIVSILREIDGLFPGLNDPPPSIDPRELVAPSMRDQPHAEGEEQGEEEEEEVGGEGGSENGTGEEVGGEEDGEAEAEEEWELDHRKLAAAIENEQLMSKIPEVDREWFKVMARRSIEAQERVELCERVRKAFDDLSVAMRAGLDETSRQLSVALTFEQLKTKQQQ
jgi:hypothetical protein